MHRCISLPQVSDYCMDPNEWAMALTSPNAEFFNSTARDYVPPSPRLLNVGTARNFVLDLAQRGILQFDGSWTWSPPALNVGAARNFVFGLLCVERLEFRRPVNMCPTSPPSEKRQGRRKRRKTISCSKMFSLFWCRGFTKKIYRSCLLIVRIGIFFLPSSWSGKTTSIVVLLVLRSQHGESDGSTPVYVRSQGT